MGGLAGIQGVVAQVRILDEVPDLRVVMEHITTKEAVRYGWNQFELQSTPFPPQARCVLPPRFIAQASL